MFLELIDLIFDGMAHGVKFLRDVKISGSVSVWTIICCSFVFSVLISGLINVVKIGGLTSRAISARRSSKERNDNV